MAHGLPGEPGADATPRVVTTDVRFAEMAASFQDMERRAKHYDALREALEFIEATSNQPRIYKRAQAALDASSK